MSDAFLAQALYRAKARVQALGVPLLPRLAHRLSMMLAQVSIGDPVVMHPGVYIVHGQVVVDGLVEIGPGTHLFPWITIGLEAGDVHGATIERDVSVGTGAKVIGNVRVGAGATDRSERRGGGRRAGRSDRVAALPARGAISANPMLGTVRRMRPWRKRQRRSATAVTAVVERTVIPARRRSTTTSRAPTRSSTPRSTG